MIKRFTWVITIAIVLFLVFPLHDVYKDGTQVYKALTYRVIIRGEDADSENKDVEVHLFPENFQNLDSYIE